MERAAILRSDVAVRQVCRQYQEHGINVERTVLVPAGPYPWVAIRLRVTGAANAQPQWLRLTEQWPLEPRFLQTWQSVQSRDSAGRLVSYAVEQDPLHRRLSATEVFSDGSGLIGEPRTLSLQVLGQTDAEFVVQTGSSWPTLTANSRLQVIPGEQQDLWLRFGCLPRRRCVDDRPAGAVAAKPATASFIFNGWLVPLGWGRFCGAAAGIAVAPRGANGRSQSRPRAWRTYVKSRLGLRVYFGRERGRSRPTAACLALGSHES